MSLTVGVNPPKTPVTEGSDDIAAATLPNMCKMPGPPAPFVPTPFPNIGKSSYDLADCTTTVKFDGNKVAIKGTTYKSTTSPDLASKASGGGVVSSKEEGTTAFAAPGSMNVKAEGKNIQLLGDAMLSNGSSSPYNSAVPSGNLQAAETLDDIHDALKEIAKRCNEVVNQEKGPPTSENCAALGTEKHKCCDEVIKDSKNKKTKSEQPYERNGSPSKKNRATAIGQGSKAKAAARAAGKKGKALNKAFTQGFKAASGFVKGFFASTPPISLDAVLFKVAPGSLSKKNMQKIFDFKFPCTDKKKGSGETAEMSAAQLDKYQTAFPGVDIATIVVRSV